ncbi:MAG: SDR family NAD(P)-dependent oxidoreductase [Hyphomicrobiales bacterium]|nr:SDR family NAD(P)-dependent oxidoreductase [Hyphomicrobiales bacterium]
MTRYCVVTGVSSGIGQAIADKLAASGFHVFGSVRRMADADALTRRFGDKATPLVFDVTDEAGVRAGAAQVAAALGEKGRLAGLVNNAGVATPGPLLHLSLDDLRRQLDINVVAQVGVTQAFAPLLGVDKTRAGAPGRIVNIVSTSGRLATPFLGAYCASKYAMEAISDTLRRELLIYGVDVIAIEPGAVVTPIWDKAENADYSAFENTDYKKSFGALRDIMIAEGRKGLPPSRIADAVHRALTDAKPPARMAIVPQRLKNWTAPRLMPDRALDKFVAKLIGLTPV